MNLLGQKLLILGSLFLSGCASVPAFTPSQPLHTVQSVREGLFICSEYHAPPNASRITALKPYVQCLEELAEQFEGFQSHPLVQVFYQELQARYDILNDAYWTPTLRSEFETAIHATLRSLWRQGGMPAETWPEFSWHERAVMLELFPKTSWMLNLANKRTTQPWKTDRQVEALLVQFLSLKPSSHRETPSSLSDCPDTQRFAAQLLHVHQLQSDLQFARELAPQSREAVEIEKRYHHEVRETWNLLASLRNRKSQLSRCNFTLILHR